jgi:hypothetical protein
MPMIDKYTTHKCLKTLYRLETVSVFASLFEILKKYNIPGLKGTCRIVVTIIVLMLSGK